MVLAVTFMRKISNFLIIIAFEFQHFLRLLMKTDTNKDFRDQEDSYAPYCDR